MRAVLDNATENHHNGEPPMTPEESTWSLMDDRQLIAESLHGKKAAFEELVLRYQNRLYNAVYRLVNNEADATDVVQETLLSAYAALQTFRGECEWYTWIYRIALNAAINLKRKQFSLVSLGHGDRDRGWLDPPDLSPANRPNHQLEKIEEEQLVQDALNRLPDEYRLALVLKEIEGLSYHDIAEILAVPIGTVRSRLHRARLKLRQWLLEEEDESIN